MNRVKLNDIAWFQEGPGIRNTQYTSGGVKLLNVSNLVNGTLDLSNSKRYISEEEAYGKYKHFLCDSGDLVIASSGITERNVNSKNAFIGSDDLPLCMNTSTIRFKSINNVSLKYLFYFFRSKDFLKQIRVLMHGSAQLNFGPSHLKLITVPIIDKKEELELCNYLDLLHTSIKVKQNELNELNNLIKSRFICQRYAL